MDTLRLVVLMTVVALGHSANRVLELSDRFLELRGESSWLLMFYAPWCGHCKKLDPVWNHVAHALYRTDIRVGRVDCTRFTSVASEFNVRGYPTIMYVKGDTRHIYNADRNKEDIVGFAIRMAAPPIQEIPSYHHLKDVIAQGDLFFSYVGTKEGPLWESYTQVAKAYRAYNYFYAAESGCMAEHTKLESDPAIMVFKDGANYFFPVPEENEYADNFTMLNETLAEWINHERFHLFTKITHGNLHQLWKINKYLAITVVHESKIGTLTNEEEMFKAMVETVIRNARNKYHQHYQFGWTGTPDLANSIAMERLQSPSLIVVNSSTMHHHLPEDPPLQLTPAAIEMFLDSVISQSAPAYGGDTWPVRFYRMFYNAKTSLEDMWLGNPVLTSVLFGLPLGFLSLICYSIWCSDIMDADEEEDQQPHEKKD